MSRSRRPKMCIKNGHLTRVENLSNYVFCPQCKELFNKADLHDYGNNGRLICSGCVKLWGSRYEEK